MADKNDTYYCSWKREPNGACVGWEIRRPKLRTTASTPIELMSALGEIVGEFYDDHEAALHFDPPLFSEAGDPAWFVDELVAIDWNASFKFRPTALTAYAGGRCARCGGGLGSRTSTPLEIDEMTEATDGASSPGSNEPLPCGGMPGSLLIVSEQFLNHLTADERATFDARPVKWTNSSRRKFFEMVPRTFVPTGAVKGLDVDGWRCDRCERRLCSHGSMLGWGVKVVCRQDLPVDSPRFFYAGADWNVRLYCTRQRWRSLVGKPWSKKLTDTRLAMVERWQFDANPLPGTLDKIAEFRRVHGFKVRFRPQQH